ncbi:MAG: family 20 glycosylhydrolase, partial [Clostridia bacterium]|nr:family 20 glycosylhydrolase [Clostridia bacterium]
MDSAYIGRLQVRLAHTVTVCSASGRPLPTPMSEGDPLCGEPLSYPWDVVRDDGVALCITLERAVYLDRAVVTVGEKTALTAAVLRDGEGNILSRIDAETGKTITERTMALTVDRETDTLSIALVSDFSDVEVLSVELYGMIGAAPIFPTPQSAVYGERELPFSRFRSVAAKTANERRAAEILCEKYGEKTGITLQITDGAADISLFTDPTVPANGYRLTVSEERTSVTASDLRGLIMGAESFLKISTETGVRTAEIEDAPFLPLRGVHLFLPALKEMDFAHRLVRDLISPMGYNLVIIEVATGMEYKSHPEINEAFRMAQEKIRAGLWPAFPHGTVAEGTVLSHEDIRAFVDDVRSFGIEVVPEVQSLGHVPYLTLAHPEIAEVEEKTGEDDIDTRAEDARPNRFYPHCYCPSNERSYEILFDILDEVIEVFRPREYVHMGHDEVYYMGLCPKCRTKPHAELFASDVNRIHAHLREKGYKMMIWSDMLQPVTKYQTPPAVDLIPKDVLCLDFIWYFHLDKDIEENLLEKGFKVAVGNLYSSHFPRYESRIRKSGMVGGQISMWVATNEGALAQEGKLYDIMMTAQMLWSESYTRHCRLAYDRLLRKEIPALRDAMRGTVSPSRRAG